MSKRSWSGKKCRNPKCSNRAGARGLCISCYNVALMSVKAGATTWDELVKHGKVEPGRAYKKTSDWLLDFRK